ncbi:MULTISPECIES: tetratricopeptide repeat-containing sensor histidine kinase [Myroides]|uniref:tetratricopeptide repeat-containing sensor histidine kinase n=1 Tax=Myroides TaxID=76831 RepID=UPI001303D107|nr:tetratricopeptide repeat-containing sensor histidine kinase [Myroides phaeus]
MKKYLSNLHFITLLLISISFVVLTSCTKENSNPPHIEEDIIAKDLQIKADSLYNLNQLKSAFHNYLDSNLRFKKQKDSPNITYNNLKIASIYLIIGDPNSAQEIVTNELRYISEGPNTYRFYVYSILSICYSDLEDYEASIAYNNLSLDLASSDYEIKMIENNNALNYIKLQQYEKAILSLQAILDSKAFEGRSGEKARVLNNLGRAKFLLNNNEGLDELKQALELRLPTSLPDDLFWSYVNLSEYYQAHDKTIGKQYAQKAFDIARDFENKNQKLIALEYLIKNEDYNPNNKYTNIDYINLSKQITTENQQAKNQYAKVRYDFDKHSRENAKLRYNLQQTEITVTKQYNVILLIFLFIIISASIFGLIYKQLKRRHKKEKLEQVYITETTIAKKVHDELANDVFNVLTLSQNFKLDTEKTKNHLINDLELIYKKARNISLQHSSISTGTKFKEHLTNLFNEYNTAACRIIITGLDKFDFDQLDKTQKITLYRVIQELLVNMKKHSMATLVVFKFEDLKNKITLFYSDNGIGIIQKEIISKNGLSNMENRIKNINGTITFDNENKLGVKYFIQLPKSYD